MIVDNYHKVQEELANIAKEGEREAAELIVVTKTQETHRVKPLLELGHKRFGENRVQEAKAKWPDLRETYSDLELHLIGPLQSNKAQEAVALFDCIQTVDREKIARAIAKEMDRQGLTPSLFVQVNTGEEPQKAGISPADSLEFVAWMKNDLDLKVRGLMCIPPADENPGPHFALLGKLANEAQVKDLSMGMSGDYGIAAKFGATHVRVGSSIFGPRA